MDEELLAVINRCAASIRDLKRDNEALRKALYFYADAGSYKALGVNRLAIVLDDKGAKARTALWEKL